MENVFWVDPIETQCLSPLSAFYFNVLSRKLDWNLAIRASCRGSGEEGTKLSVLFIYFSLLTTKTDALALQLLVYSSSHR